MSPRYFLPDALRQRAGSKLRLGIYGGTFDPVHHGHLIVAADAVEELRLDYVLFIPCAISPHKRGVRSASGAHRAAMLQKALRRCGGERFLLSQMELTREGVSYSVDTAAYLATELPKASLYWLIGADQLPKLHTWFELERLQRLVTFAVMNRGEAKPALPKGCLWLKRERRIDIGATEIRRRVREGKPFEQLVPAAVAAYIHANELYRA
ncbi:MAG: nicotinate (nicotinamide) nucleotide adenylyltransferase [Verrucomicrobiota bacterium]